MNAEASTCETVTRILNTPYQELSFGGRKPGSIVKNIGKMKKQQGAQFAGSSLCEAKMKIPEKITILARLLNRNEPARIQSEHQ